MENIEDTGRLQTSHSAISGNSSFATSGIEPAAEPG